jgi:glycosyltransferase involved in cell wall biosynthesis
MRILFLTQIIPYPPDAGPKVKTWNVLRYLAGQGHEITLASFVRPEEIPYVNHLKEVCTEVHTVPIRRSRPADLLYFARSLRTGRPFLIERDDLPEMRALIRRLLAEKRYDCIQADQLTMAQFALPTDDQGPAAHPHPFTVFDAHNAVWTITERMSRAVPAPLKPFLSLETRRTRLYEGMLLERFDHTLAVTEIDRDHLLKAYADYSSRNRAARREPEISVIPIAVDTTQIRPVQPQKSSRNILTLGTLHYPPNADGIRWFVQEVFENVRRQDPQATLTIVGKNPPQDFLALAAERPDAVKVTGYVPDLRPYMEQAALLVVPVRVGSGMRVRILEALAYGMPTVTTTIGLEGIEARNGEEVLVADDPQAFSDAVLRLLQDEDLRTKLSRCGRRLAEERYDWQVALRKMDSVYQSKAIPR